MLHELREGLFFGRQVADARLGLVLERYRHAGLSDLLGTGNSLFWPEDLMRNDETATIHQTGLLDALDLAEFWEGQS